MALKIEKCKEVRMEMIDDKHTYTRMPGMS